MKQLKVNAPGGYIFGEFNKTTGEVELIPVPKIELGKWYKEIDGLGLVLYKEDGMKNYGFVTGEDRWSNIIYFGDNSESRKRFKKATPEEVKERLIAEAKKRGYKKGNVICLAGRLDDEFNPDFSEWYFSGNALYSNFKGNGGQVIFRAGQWAEILPAKPKYPTKIEEVKGRNWIINTNRCAIKKGSIIDSESFLLSSQPRAKAFLALMQLVELRDAWNKVDGFVVDWKDNKQFKYCIILSHGNLSFKKQSNHQNVLYFSTWETRELFYDTFRPLIEEAKELI